MQLSDSPSSDLPHAGHVPGAAAHSAPGSRAGDGIFRLVINLMLANLALGVLLGIGLLVLHGSVVDYQVANALPANTSPSQIDGARTGFAIGLWVKLGTTLILSIVYVLRAYGLRRRANTPGAATRGPYVRMLVLCIIGVLGMAYLILSGQYPVWIRVEQALQAVLVVAMLVVVTRPGIRHRFGRAQNAVS